MTEHASFPASASVLVGRLSEKLKAHSFFLGTAESCTGGMIAALCTDFSGSSTWFSGGIVSYSNAVKHAVLGVPEETLEREGAVSEAVVRRMVEGAIHVLDVDVAVAVSGIAGPDGGTAHKPVGTVWIAAGVRSFSAGQPVLALSSVCKWFPGNRAEVRWATVCSALEMAERLLPE